MTTSTSRTGGRRGEALDEIPLPANVDIGDAIKAMKSALLAAAAARVGDPPGQISLLEPVVTQAVAAMERDVIKRTY